MIRIARYGSVATAAAVLLALVVSFLVLDRNAPLAFGQVVENVKKAKSVSFTLKQKLTPESQSLEQKWFLLGDSIRMEIPGTQEAFHAEEGTILAAIGNLKEKKALQLDFVRKTAQWLDIEKNVPKQFANPIDRLRQLKDQDAKRVADEELDGRKTHVYELAKLDFFGGKGKIEEGESAKVWVDPKSGLPVRIVIEGWNADKKAKMKLIFEQFTWNEELAPEMFKLEVPKGFTVEEE
jgi:outer membrane lipoprotein-sorting protein